MKIDGTSGMIGRRFLELPIEDTDVFVNLRWNTASKFARDAFSQFNNVPRILTDIAIEKPKKYVGIGSQAELHPTTMYGLAKVAAREATRLYCLQNNIQWVWVRLYSVYGPGDRYDAFIPTVMRMLKKGEPITISTPDKRWDYLYVDDAVEAIRHYTLGDYQGIYDVGYGCSYKMRYIGELLGEVSGRPDLIRYEENDGAQQSVFCPTDWTPRVKLRDGLRMVWEST